MPIPSHQDPPAGPGDQPPFKDPGLPMDDPRKVPPPPGNGPEDPPPGSERKDPPEDVPHRDPPPEGIPRKDPPPTDPHIDDPPPDTDPPDENIHVWSA